MDVTSEAAASSIRDYVPEGHSALGPPSFLEPHSIIRKANKIAPKAQVERVELEDECHAGFYVHYDNGQTAEVSWAFIRELPPKKNPAGK